MPQPPRASPTVVRALSTSAATVVSMLLACAIAGLLAVLASGGVTPSGIGGVWALIGILVAGIATVVHFARRSVEFHEDHLVVRRSGRRWRLHYDEIAAIRGGVSHTIMAPRGMHGPPEFVTDSGAVVAPHGDWQSAEWAIERIADHVAARLESRLRNGETLVFRKTQTDWWPRLAMAAWAATVVYNVATHRASDLFRFPGGITNDLVWLALIAGGISLRTRGTRRVAEISVTLSGIRLGGADDAAADVPGGYRSADASSARRIPWWSVLSITLAEDGLRIATDSEREVLVVPKGIENLYALRRLALNLGATAAREWPLRSANVRIDAEAMPARDEDEPALEGTEVEAVRAKGERGRT